MEDKNVINSVDILRNTLNFQFDISWQLLEYHLIIFYNTRLIFNAGRTPSRAELLLA